jgi:hypothetical protein
MVKKIEDDTSGAVPPKVEEGKEKVVMITEKKLAEILKNVEAGFASQIEELKKDNRILYEAADKTLLGKVLNKDKKSMGMSVMLSTLDGKVIVGWRTVVDIVEKNANGVWQEKQVMEIKLEDDKTVEHPYNKFTDIIAANRINAKVLSRSVDEDENVTYKVKADNGKEYSISATFVN